jgi:hypothetical protein
MPGSGLAAVFVMSAVLVIIAGLSSVRAASLTSLTGASLRAL